jgi:NitT/TauT family transport system ATP-binding protein
VGVLAAQRARVDDAIALVRLQKFADAYPHQLSGGMAQRAALARALVNNPHLLLLDEPFGKLDSLTRLAMQTELLALWQTVEFTALLVTHDAEKALLLADRMIVLPRPAGAHLAEYVVGKPQPRRREDVDLVRLRQTVLQTLGTVYA